MRNRKIIIIEASHINFGGGLTLLRVLVEELENSKLDTIVFIKSVKIILSMAESNYKYIKFIKTSTISTLYRYFLTRENVLFFCSLPPFSKQSNSLLYFHNPHFSSKPILEFKSYTFYSQFKFYLYHGWLKTFAKNIDIIGCQTTGIQEELRISGIGATVLPFYGHTEVGEKTGKYDFCYISTVAPHKNHYNLFKAIAILAESHHFTFAVTITQNTVNSDFLKEIDIINTTCGREVIINKGRLNRQEVIELYRQTRALVFPSFKESFGLPLIEALQCKLVVLAADRTYTHDIVRNAIVFDPFDPLSIANTMKFFLENKYCTVDQGIKPENAVESIIRFFKT